MSNGNRSWEGTLSKHFAFCLSSFFDSSKLCTSERRLLYHHKVRSQAYNELQKIGQRWTLILILLSPSLHLHQRFSFACCLRVIVSPRINSKIELLVHKWVSFGWEWNWHLGLLESAELIPFGLAVHSEQGVTLTRIQQILALIWRASYRICLRFPLT